MTHPVTNIDGIGPGSARSLAGIGIINVAGLLRHYPVRYEDRQTPIPLAWSTPERPAVTIATVVSHESFRWKRGTALKVVVADETDQASMLCYGRSFLAGKLPPGKKIRLTGPFERNHFGELQSGTFVFENFEEDSPSREFERILPVYALGGSLTQGLLRKTIEHALNSYAMGIRNEVPFDFQSKRKFPDKKEALRHVHFPPQMMDAEIARQALIYEELLHLQLTLLRRTTGKQGHAPGRWEDKLIKRLAESLPFELTPDQETTLEEIRNDVMSSRPMIRLLQGEVGSGKTLVAFMAALGIIAAGRQAAFMAPTELLARQHADNAASLLEPLGIRVAFLTGEVGGAPRRSLVEALAKGEVDLAVGTHALFSSDVSFKDLGLAIIDEQHRFGVEQRQALAAKGLLPDILSLSATPIPRTLALTAFGDMDTSSIRTMPTGRLPVETHLARMGNELKVYNFVRQELQLGHRAYFVYPLIEESEKTELKDAENMYDRLSTQVFPEFRCALVHSRIDEAEKRRIMQSFRSGDLDILVATSVVEVGVDVPEATCMVVEHAERFGLSALHQLRGRVGRGKDQSYCFLVYAEPLSEEGIRRMKVMKETNNGFVLAEEDLKMRGPGNMAGTRQSGFLKFTIADPVRDMKVLLSARKDARNIIEADPSLLEPAHRNLRELFSRCPPFDENLVATG